MTNAGAIEIRSVRWSYAGSRRRGPVVAIDDLTLDIAPGDWVSLLGPNGSGKSTLLRMLATLEPAPAGTIRVLGVDTARAGRELSQCRRGLGVVFQSPALDRLLTIRENLTLAGRLFGLRREALARAIDRCANAAGVADRLDDQVRRLSGGLARRADLARAMLPGPRLLLLDEATVGLDLQARRAFIETLASIRRERAPGELTIVSSTHMMDEAEAADRVVMLDRGRIVADGSPLGLRTAMGGLLVRWRSSDAGRSLAAELVTLGAEVREPPGAESIISTPDPETLDRVVVLLSRRGAWFEVGPPTLADVYLARTGRGLEEGGAT